jgi:acyl-CoA reductase-like NAD-dependent aldehyde dehydrogenase
MTVSSAPASFSRRSPLDDEDLGPYRLSGPEEVDEAVRAAAAGFKTWSRTPAPRRSDALHSLADTLVQHRARLAGSITREEGKRLSEAAAEVDHAVRQLRYFADLILVGSGSVLEGSAGLSLNLARRRPLGPVGLITPWNFPLLVPVRKIAPCLAYGNSFVLKPSQESPATALLLFELLEEAGVLPGGVANLVTGEGPAGEALVEHSEIRAISFTGSTPTGIAIQRAAAGRPQPVPVQAEMGGKNVLLVTEHADLDVAATIAMDGVLKGSGQRCTCTGLILAQDSVAEALSQELGRQVSALRLGPGSEEADLPPLVSAAQLRRAEDIVERSERAGARRVAAATPPPGRRGWFFPAMVLDRVTPEMPLAFEEIFAPVFPICSYRHLDEAIEWVNGLPYGLSASVVTRDLDQALLFADRVEVGIVKVNQETGTAEPHFPFGGWKGSGFGPAEQGVAAAEFYTRRQTVHLLPSPAAIQSPGQQAARE